MMCYKLTKQIVYSVNKRLNLHILFMFIFDYMISNNKNIISCVQVYTKILYYFIIFATINKKLIRKDRPIHASVNVQRQETAYYYIVTRNIGRSIV